MSQRRRALPLRVVTLRVVTLLAMCVGLLVGVLPAATHAAAPPGRLGELPAQRAATVALAATPDRTPASQVVTARGRSAIRWAERRTHYPTRRCIVFVRTALQVPGRYGTPRVAWVNARHRHHTAYRDIPAGVPVFTAGRTAPGHVVLSLGNGKIRSTDWPRPGRVGTVSLATFLRTWNHRYLGWSEDLNGVRVWHR